MEKVVVTYHKDCIDGTTAAAVVLRKFPQAKLFPLAHAYTKEDMEAVLDYVTSETVAYTVDCGLGAKEMLVKGIPVTTLDHHVGAKELWENLAKEYPNYTFVFDNEKSGASVTWSHLFPHEELPELIKCVEDGDLWRWKYGQDARDVNNYLSMFRNQPEAVLNMLEGNLTDIKAKGKVLSMNAEKEVESQTQLAPITLSIGAHRVPAYNITVYQSASGNNLSEKIGKAVAMYTVNGDQVKFGFRSKQGQEPSALALAKALGGGGHQNASGAEVPLEKFLGMILKNETA